jgi:hypothetical protein
MKEMALTRKTTKIDPNQAYVCVLPFATNTEIYTFELELRGDHPAVTGHPTHWRSKSTPRSEWPSPLDSVIAAGDEADARAAAANRIKLAAPAPPPMMRSTVEIQTMRDGQPVTIVKGSQVAPDDPLVGQHPEAWEAAS